MVGRGWERGAGQDGLQDVRLHRQAAQVVSGMLTSIWLAPSILRRPRGGMTAAERCAGCREAGVGVERRAV